jgi:hypothetical protein
MQTPQYPTITDAALTPFRALEIQLKDIPDLLDRAECPYPPTIRAMLRRLTRTDMAGVHVEKGDPLTQADEGALVDEIAALYRSVKTDATAYVGTDIKDKMSLMKTSNDLLTKLVDLQGKAFNIRAMARMQRLIVETMEEHLTPGQRTEFITKLEALQDV